MAEILSPPDRILTLRALDSRRGLEYILSTRGYLGRDAFEGFLGRFRACWELTYQRPYFFVFISTSIASMEYNRLPKDSSLYSLTVIFTGIILLSNSRGA